MANTRVKVPVIMQMEMLECGAAALAMILAYYGKWLPLEKVREDCGVSRDGSKAKNILLAARSYGLDAKGYRGEVEDVKNAKFPCIIHWNFNHFVVLNGFSDKYAYINDPSSGETRVTMESFDKSFTGIYMVFERTDALVLEGKPKSVVEFAARRLKGTLVPFLFVVITGLLSAVIGVGRVRDNRQLASYFQQVYRIDQRYDDGDRREPRHARDNRREPFRVFAREYPVHEHAGEHRVNPGRQYSNETIAETLISQLAPLFLNFILMIFYFVVMISYSLPLTVLGLFSIAVNIPSLTMSGAGRSR